MASKINIPRFSATRDQVKCFPEWVITSRWRNFAKFHLAIANSCQGSPCNSEISASQTFVNGFVLLSEISVVNISPKYRFQVMRNVGEISRVRKRREFRRTSCASLLHNTVTTYIFFCFVCTRNNINSCGYTTLGKDMLSPV